MASDWSVSSWSWTQYGSKPFPTWMGIFEGSFYTFRSTTARKEFGDSNISAPRERSRRPRRIRPAPTRRRNLLFIEIHYVRFDTVLGILFDVCGHQVHGPLYWSSIAHSPLLKTGSRYHFRRVRFNWRRSITSWPGIFSARSVSGPRPLLSLAGPSFSAWNSFIFDSAAGRVMVSWLV